MVAQDEAELQEGAQFLIKLGIRLSFNRLLVSVGLGRLSAGTVVEEYASHGLGLD